MRTEQKIVEYLLNYILDRNYLIGLNNEEEEVVPPCSDIKAIGKELASTDVDYLFVYTPNKEFIGSIMLVYGNDIDVICDYSQKIAFLVDPVIDYVNARYEYW